MFDGPLGIIAVIILIVLFIQSFGWKKEIKVQENPDEILGRTVRRAFKLLDKKEESNG